MNVMSIRTKLYGDLLCFAAMDEAKNQIIIPIAGVTLDAWRANKSLVPPCLLPEDLEVPSFFKHYLEFLQKEVG